MSNVSKNSADTLSRAYADFQRPPRLRRIGESLSVVAAWGHRKSATHVLTGWDRAVYHQHSAVIVDRVIDEFHNQLQAVGFRDVVIVDGHEKQMTFQDSVFQANREWGYDRNKARINLHRNIIGWSLARDYAESDDRTGSLYEFVALFRLPDAHNLGKVRVLTGDKEKGNDQTFDLRYITLAQVVRRPYHLEYLDPAVRAGHHLRKYVPQFRKAAVDIIVPEHLRVPRRQDSGGVNVNLGRLAAGG